MGTHSIVIYTDIAGWVLEDGRRPHTRNKTAYTAASPPWVCKPTFKEPLESATYPLWHFLAKEFVRTSNPLSDESILRGRLGRRNRHIEVLPAAEVSGLSDTSSLNAHPVTALSFFIRSHRDILNELRE